MGYEDGMPWYEGLSESVMRIAEADHSPLKIVSGPGTGKTFALMRRVARLLQSGIEPASIFVSTFTRTAASDLQNEIASLGIDGAETVNAGTLHAFCFSLLSREHFFEYTGRIPRPLLKFEERFLLQDLNREDYGRITDRRERLEAFNAAWARLQTEEPGWATDPIDQSFQRELLAWLSFHRAMLIGEIVPEALRYLRDNPIITQQNAFEHVLVDEFQDLNRAEQELIYCIAGSGTLTIAGDGNQSIYAFKQAHPEGIIEFNQHFPGTHTESLMQCRRCPSSIVQMANTLISNNEYRTERQITPCPDNPVGEVIVAQWLSMEQEAQGIAQFISQRIDAQQFDAGNVLVLAPRRRLGYAIRDALSDLCIPAHSFFHEEALEGSPGISDQCEAQQAFTLLTLLANPEDRVALRCWCGFGSSSLRNGAWTRLRTFCEENGGSPNSVLESLSSGSINIPHTGEIVHRYQDLQVRLQELQNLEGQQLLDTLFPADADWSAPFRSLVSSEDESGAGNLREILRVGIIQPELPTDVDYVRVMSLHKSKGLTADLVIVAGCVEGLVPFVKEVPSIVQRNRLLEEQRRLFYVAITRTRSTLVLSSVIRIPRSDAYSMGIKVRGGDRIYANTIASGFLSELGPTRPAAVMGASIIRRLLDKSQGFSSFSLLEQTPPVPFVE